MAEGALRAVLFDIDGTLIHSGGSSDRAWHRAFEEIVGVEVDVAAVTGQGVPDPEVGRRCFAAALGRDPAPGELDALMERRLAHLPEEVERSPDYRVLDGAVELLQRLRADGCLLGLTTGNVEPAARIKLDRGDLNRFFEFGGFSSDSSDRTELTMRALERARSRAGDGLDDASVVSVGDTPRDIEAGHGAGIRVVGVATGEYSEAELRDAGADFTLAALSAWPPRGSGL